MISLGFFVLILQPKYISQLCGPTTHSCELEKITTNDFFELFDSEVVLDFLFRPLLDDVDMRSGIASESGVEMAAWRVGAHVLQRGEWSAE